MTQASTLPPINGSDRATTKIRHYPDPDVMGMGQVLTKIQAELPCEEVIHQITADDVIKAPAKKPLRSGSTEVLLSAGDSDDVLVSWQRKH